MWQISSGGRIERLVVFRAARDTYVPAGELTFEGGGRRRVGRFVYARSLLEKTAARPIDPIGLPLRRGSTISAPNEVPLAFYDAGPDGWGQGVLRQAFQSLDLSMPEFLALGGRRRTGDLAFGPTPAGPRTWVPDEKPFGAIPNEDDDLEALVVAVAAVDEGEGKFHHFRLLIRESADVGGARPKARLWHRGIDWIAKFPTWSDRFDEPRVEAACLDVAEAAGLAVPERIVMTIAKRAVLLVRRFDREADSTPISYLSFGTLLREPPENYGTSKTYVDIAVAARTIGVPSPEAEVFRRLLVNSYLHNTDDHLRNHAVINDGNGWRLSPVFDVVSHPGRQRHVCAPAPKMSLEWNPALAFSAHAVFGLSKADAEQIREQVVTAARRLPEFLADREVSTKDRSTLLGALPRELGLSIGA